jgi:tetratricopeptide (TPR) repeat protein
MPQSDTDIPHIAFTHHRIGIHSQAASGDDREFRPLTPILDDSHLPEIDRVASLGLAYLKYAREHEGEAGVDQYVARSRPLIEAAVSQGLRDARLEVAQAELEALAGNAEAAVQSARRTLASADLAAPERAAALRVLAGVALNEQRPAEAVIHLEELTTLRRDPRDWFLLGVCRQRLGDLAGAAAALERVLQIDPAEPETYLALAPIYRTLGDESREAWCRERAALIRKASSPNL